MSFKCQIFRKRLTFRNVLEISCDVRIIILFCLIAILPPNIKCAKLQNPQIRLLINDDDLLHEKSSRHEAAAAAGGGNVPENSGEHFNLYRSELKRLSYETIHRILRDENEPSYRREETELRYYQKRSPPAYEESHLVNKRSAAEDQHNVALNYSKRNLREFVLTAQLAKELAAAASLDLSDNRLATLNLSLIINEHIHSLNLSNNSFAYIPLTENSSLKSLNLNSNDISSSPMPANVYLRNLYLSGNHIENLLSLNLSLLKNLEILDISCNRLKNLETSFFPERMHNLKHLNLAHNQLGAIYRETFYNLLSLNTLLLGHNNITDIDYETFLALPNLQYLDLSYNRLKGKSIRALQGITGLVALNIAYNPELGPFMQEFVASWSLKELDASGTGLCQIPAALAQSVRSLKLTHNWLKVINCGDLDSYPLLQYLDISFSHIEHIEDDALGRLEILEILMLDNNALKRIPLSLPVSLEHLFLQNNNIMDIQSQSFQGLTSLKTLDLSHNKLLYLPDIALPKLQTLNLQSAEIRGISQGIVHTLPRLNELLLEDNPIKCSDLLGIAEWASTCRLRSAKEELEDNGAEEESMADDEVEVDQRKADLKMKYLKMYNFYEKFEGEQCRQNLSLPQLVLQPSCASTTAEAYATSATIRPRQESQLEANMKGSSATTTGERTEVGNFNISSLIAAIPLPAKKAVKTSTEHPNKTATIVDVAAKAITTEMPSPTIVQMEQQHTETSIGARATTAPHHFAATSETSQTFEALASADKPQEHSRSPTDETKTFAKTTTAAYTDAVKGIAIGRATDEATTTGNSSRSSPSKATVHQRVVGVEQTSVESLRSANPPETLKQNVADSIIKNDNKHKEMPGQHKEVDADNMTTTTTTTAVPLPAEVAVDEEATTGAAAYATAINSQKPETLTTATITRTTATAATTTTPPKPMINLFKEKLQHEKEIKTEIGPTEEIKSFERSTMAPASSATHQASLAVGAGTATATTTELPLKAPTKMADYSNTSNKELDESTTSTVTTSSTTNSRVNITIATTSTPSVQASTSTTLMATASIQPQQASISMAVEETTAAAAAIQDKDLASNNTDNGNNDNANNNHSLYSNMAHADGQDNKTLVTLHITTPITPNIALHSNDQHPHPGDTEPRPRPQPEHEQYDNAAIQQQQQHPSTTATMPTTSRNDVTAECMQSNANACTSGRPQRQDKANVIGRTPANMESTTATTATPTETLAFRATTTTTAAAVTMSTTSAATATATPTATAHKHEPLQLHIKDRHLIGTPLLMHKGDNLMVATDELIKASTQDTNSNSKKPPLPQSAASATGPPKAGAGAKNKPNILDRSQTTTKGHKKPDPADIHHEPLEHKGETIKTKDYSQFKKSNADVKTKKPSLIMKKMTIITKQHEATTPAVDPPDAAAAKANENEIHHQQRDFVDSHYQELKPLHAAATTTTTSEAKEPPSSSPPSHSKHSTVNTPINKQSHLVHEPQTFQHEHELLLQQILHDEQQQQHDKATQSEQWSDLRKAGNKDNHPGLILLVSSGLFVVLLLGLMHVYRCDVPWRRPSPAHHLRPHQRHNGQSLDDDVHSFLSYNEGIQKWHHSTRLEAPYSSPLHNLHVRELQKTSATEKPATFKTSTSYKTAMNRSHILPRTNSQSSSATTRTTSPSSSAILDDETFYIEMTPPSGQFAQALQSELLPMELLNMAQTKSAETRETSTDLQTSMEDDFDFATTSAAGHHHVTTTTTARSELLTSSASASAYNNKPLYNSRKFGLW